MHGDGQEKRRDPNRRLVVVQQSGIQELTICQTDVMKLQPGPPRWAASFISGNSAFCDAAGAEANAPGLSTSIPEVKAAPTCFEFIHI
jgi:hypothetical protein